MDNKARERKRSQNPTHNKYIYIVWMRSIYIYIQQGKKTKRWKWKQRSRVKRDIVVANSICYVFGFSDAKNKLAMVIPYDCTLN